VLVSEWGTEGTGDGRYDISGVIAVAADGPDAMAWSLLIYKNV
jgi:hypothetical protein